MRDVPHGQISPPEDATSAPSESITEREWSAIACRRLFLAASLMKVAALLLWRVRAGALAWGCTGYLGHPFKNEHVETENDRLSLLANTKGLVYNPKSSIAS